MQINGGPAQGEQPATAGPDVARLRHLIASSKEFGFSVSTADLMAAVAFQAPTRMVFGRKFPSASRRPILAGPVDGPRWRDLPTTLMQINAPTPKTKTS